VDIII